MKRLFFPATLVAQSISNREAAQSYLIDVTSGQARGRTGLGVCVAPNLLPLILLLLLLSREREAIP